MTAPGTHAGDKDSSPSQGGCPVDHSKFKKPETKPNASSGCPVDHSKFAGRRASSDELNPLNMMPKLSQDMASGQTEPLSTERTVSSIPKSSESSSDRWEYPSPQQFYNALKRKGKEAPEKHITAMVDIHNFLNEACWDEIQKWEAKYHCECNNVSLVKFQGKPDDLSPLAWFYTTFMGAERPFDRHDWTIDRCGQRVRYVIDYYSAPDVDGNPAFSADLRPALDSPSAAVDRIRNGFSSVWTRFFGESRSSTA